MQKKKHMNARRLSDWLFQPKKNYNDGISLLEELNIDSKSIMFLKQKHPGKIHFSILERKLSNFARIHNITPATLPIPVVNSPVKSIKQVAVQIPVIYSEIENKIIQRPKIDKNPVVRYEDLPANLQLLYDENGRMITELKTYHAEIKQLKDVDTATERRKILAEEIVRLQKATRENWDIIDAWWAKKQESNPLRLAAEEALSKDRRIKANLAYIRRYLGKSKVREEVELRMKELDRWEVDYGNLTKNFNDTWA